MTVLFLHPDLGIGGAERAIVDAAMAAKSIGYDVEIITNYHDHSHCFEETANGTLKVTPVFQWLPRTTFGKITAVWAFVKMVLAAIWICLFRRSQAELIFVDQVSAPLPILRLFGFKTVFYGHFPDMLLASHASTMRRAYRSFVDKFEELTTVVADVIVVNSNFTGGSFPKIFIRYQLKRLRRPSSLCIAGS
uniref:Alpha-1,3/1,6-mannosyltransferase ALG2 n=1 Tax=Schistocephalus solidus TaxID=70667 RepID=A0A0X3PHK0_SCHSO